MRDDFDGFFRRWVRTACEAWRYPEPGDDYYQRIYSRLPHGLRDLIAVGVKEGLITPEGPKFTLKGLSGKGPYAWFSHRSPSKGPAPNWEYFVQAAEFVRLSHIATSQGLKVTFEDQLMDLALYRGGRLLVYCEVKEHASQIQKLVKEIRAYENGINMSEPDRGNDPLRKAKYLVRQRPDYLSLVAIGVRLEYHVRYPERRAFELIRDVIPWV